MPTATADNEKLLTVEEILERVPYPVDRSTISRWFHRGILTSDGHRIRLRSRRVGLRRLVRPVDLDVFLHLISDPTG